MFVEARRVLSFSRFSPYHPLIPCSRVLRYQDAGVAAMFWKALDDVIYNKKPYLLPRGVSNIGSGQKSAALVGTPGAR